MSPDTVSSLFPDRPIRPLPKRRLRERLSPEVADSIKYPVLTYDAAPLFYYPPYALKDEASPPRVVRPVEQARRHESGRQYLTRRSGTGLSEGDGEVSIRSSPVARSPPEILARAPRRSSRSDQPRQTHPQPPPSTASSADGYDSLENTNNKKKRKIPAAGDSSLNGTHALNNEIGSLAISSATQSSGNEVNGDRVYSQSATGAFVPNNQSISGPGRGRLGRSGNGRSPLRALSDGNNTWAGRSQKASPAQWASSDKEGTGIISTAIAKAGKLPPQGQENVSLLQQHSSAIKATPASTQFTFTCDSQVPGTVQWPGHPNKHSMGTQTVSPTLPESNETSRVVQGSSSKAASAGSRKPRKTRRQIDKQLDDAAASRRNHAASDFCRNPPKPENIWICELCEYERIFGQPPRALIRKYELKDLKHRQEKEDRKRLLEKAKTKGRKGRKNSKVPAKGGPVTDQTLEQSQTEPSDNSRSTCSQEGDSVKPSEQSTDPPPIKARSNGGREAIA